MDFIKKHFEKILLALALLILIGVAVFLAIKISQLSNEVKGGGFRRQPTNKGIDRVATDIFTNAIAGLENPSLWHSNAIDPFLTSPQYIDIPTPGPTNNPTEPFLLRDVIYTKFQLKFMSYTGDGEAIAVNFLNKNRSYLGLKVGDEIMDQFGDTGYHITKFEHKEVTIHVPGIDTPRVVDVSELTIQARKGNPVILVLGTVTNEKEPLAILLCTGDRDKVFKVHKGDTITCAGKPYKVVDITSTQVIILDVETNEQHIIDKEEVHLPGVKE